MPAIFSFRSPHQQEKGNIAYAGKRAMSRQSWRLCGAWVHGALRQMHCLLRPKPSLTEDLERRTPCCRRT